MDKHKVIKFNRTGHIALWEWLSKELAKGSLDIYTYDWPEWKENGGKYRARNYCFACSYDNRFRKYSSGCEHCPLIQGCWPLSAKLRTARIRNDYVEASRLAWEMAHSEVKGNVICK